MEKGKFKDLEKLARNIPEQFEINPQIENEDSLPTKPSSIVVCGMGGSGIIGDLLKSLLPEKEILVHKDYNLLKNIEENSLVITVSYSGETEETISAYKKALGQKKHLALVTGGGDLLDVGRKNKTPLIKIPFKKELPTRLNLGYLLRAVLEILEKTEFIYLLEEGLRDKDEMKIFKEEEIRSLAEKMKNKTLLIYSSPEVSGLAELWKENLNETAKIPAFANTVPEVSHNEIESINSIDRPFLLLLIDSQEKEETQKRFGLLQDQMKRESWEGEIIKLNHHNRLIDILENSVLSLSTSIYLSLFKGIDPIETQLLEKTKKSL